MRLDLDFMPPRKTALGGIAYRADPGMPTGLHRSTADIHLRLGA